MSTVKNNELTFFVKGASASDVGTAFSETKATIAYLSKFVAGLPEVKQAELIPCEAKAVKLKKSSEEIELLGDDKALYERLAEDKKYTCLTKSGRRRVVFGLRVTGNFPMHDGILSRVSAALGNRSPRVGTSGAVYTIDLGDDALQVDWAELNKLFLPEGTEKISDILSGAVRAVKSQGIKIKLETDANGNQLISLG
jgi:hypothetical protein